MASMFRSFVAPLTLVLVGCGSPRADSASSDSGVARDLARPVDVPSPSDAAVQIDADLSDGGGSSPAPWYVDPPWTEPAPPTEAEVASAVSSAQAAAAMRLGADAVSTLHGHASSPAALGAAVALLADRRFDAATWLLSEMERASPRPAQLAALAGLEALRGGDGHARAEVLARRALAQIGPAEALPVARRRVAASAWNNLAFARLARAESSGAVHAWRRASALFDADPVYTTGLAASLAAAGQSLPALLHALRAKAREELANPTLATDARRATPARDWVTSLGRTVDAGVAPPPEPGRGGGPGGTPLTFPAVGSEIGGLRVLATTAEGIAVGPPPYEPHGTGHTVREFNCAPRGAGVTLGCVGVPDGGLGGWAPVPTQVVVGSGGDIGRAGTTCDNALDRLLSPPPEPIALRRTPGSPLGGYLTPLGFALGEELRRRGTSPYGVSIAGANGVLTGLEVCSGYRPRASAINSAYEVVRRACPACASGCNAECMTCWQDYRAACDTMFRESATLLAQEDLRARIDDVPYQRNIERSFAVEIAVANEAIRQRALPCRGDAGVGACPYAVAADDYRLVGMVPLLGGRAPAALASLRSMAQAQWLRCVAAIPPPCPASSGGRARMSASQVPCVCLGAGVVSVCLQADGTFAITGGEVFMVGVRGNLNRGAASYRYSVGAGLAAGVGVATGSASLMLTYDAATGGFSLDPSFDVSVGLPGGGSVGTSVMCDAWQDGAPTRAADPDDLSFEATPGSARLD